jgi:hypothetical protein
MRREQQQEIIPPRRAVVKGGFKRSSKFQSSKLKTGIRSFVFNLELETLERETSDGGRVGRSEKVRRSPKSVVLATAG